ncbi:MAG: glycosyltransferase family 4 protein [Bacteroidota bacterium]|nr:glycosyltransferase family 4 protein [Bacteroidota bacterium]
MKIAIEAQRLFRKKKHGMEIVALEIIKELQKINTDDQFFILAKDDEDDRCLPLNKNFLVKKITAKLYPYWEQVKLPQVIKKIKPDLLHCTANTAPLFISTPLVITIHDVIYMESVNFSGSSYQNFGNLYRKFIVPKVARKAKVIITVSEFEKKVIAKKLQVPEEKIRVIYNAVNPQFKRISSAGLLPFKNKYHLPDKFILHFGNTAPKKNTIGVLKAYAHYQNDNNKNKFALVITDCSRGYIEGLLKEINQPALLKSIHILTYISFTEVPHLYNLANVFLYPSHRESFGMPVVEAMACGIPVITSNTSALPEIAGDAAILIDPKNAVEIAAQIHNLENDSELYNYYKEKGLINATRFNWNKAACKILKIYKELAQ